MSRFNVAVVGATGQVGRAMRTLLEERGFLVETIRFFSSARSAGQTLTFRGQDIVVEDIATADYSGTDTGVFSAGTIASREYAPKLAAAGTVVVDNSSAWRKDPEVPLVVSEVNLDDVGNHPKGIIVDPNCTTMAAMSVLKPLVEAVGGIKRPFVPPYQAVSGSGRAGIVGLTSQIEVGIKQDLAGLALDGRVVTLPESGVYITLIAFDVVPLIGSTVDNGSEETDEEQKPRNKSRRILRAPNPVMSDTCVRAPAYTGHALTIHAEFAGDITPDQARALLVQVPGVRVVGVPTPLEAVGRDEVFVGRIRHDQAVDGNCGLVLAVPGNNLRKGAVLNAAQAAGVVTARLR